MASAVFHSGEWKVANGSMFLQAENGRGSRDFRVLKMADTIGKKRRFRKYFL